MQMRSPDTGRRTDRTMIKKILLLLIIAVALSTEGCSLFRDPYIGEYASTPEGDAFLKVVKQNGEYCYSTIEDGAWDNPRPMRVMEQKEYDYIVGNDCGKCMKGGIATEVVVLLRVKNGAHCDRIPFESGYMFISFLGIDFLYRVN